MWNNFNAGSIICQLLVTSLGTDILLMISWFVFNVSLVRCFSPLLTGPRGGNCTPHPGFVVGFVGAAMNASASLRSSCRARR